jgi:hypothetical protein
MTQVAEQREPEVVSLKGLYGSRSLWVARHRGSHRMRIRWQRWYDTPKARPITWATWLQIQRSPLKPKATAPSSNGRGIWAFSTGVKRGDAPVAFRRRSPWISPSLAHRSHWLTAPGVAPSASSACGGSFCFQPRWLNSKARNCRPSRRSAA